MTTACALVSYFYGYRINEIAEMTLYQFRTYLYEVSQIMRLFNGQAPMRRPAEINRLAQALGMKGPNG